ncbi:MAG: DUF6785 family protein [Gemmatimonadota bacterium]
MGLGLGLVLLICLGAPYSIWMVGSSEITWSFFPIGVGLPFVLLVFANAALRRARPAWCLAPAELVTVVTMGLVAAGIPVFIVGLLLAIPTKPYYGATPENQWADFIQPYLPAWAIPGAAAGDDAVLHFYEGLPAGASVPYRAWLGPLAWWLSLILAVYFLCFCLVVVLRRQWAEHERLAFPITEVPRLLIEEPARGALPEVMRARPFWIGCAVPVAVILFNAVSYLEPGFPQLNIHEGGEVNLFDGAPSLVLKLYFPVIGFAYLISTPISFSIWFFHLLGLAESALLAWLGIVTLPSAFVSGQIVTLGWQCSGAFAAMVAVSLWMARRHLLAVVRTALGMAGGVDDREEMMSYRGALAGGLAAGAYILAWLWRSGMSPGTAALFLAGAVVVYVGMTRVVVQSGVYYLTSPFSPQYLTLAITGTAVSPYSLVALALSYSWCSDIQSIFMAAAAHGARLNTYSRRPRRLGLAMAVAAVVGFVSCILFVLHLGYRDGAGNFRSWYFLPGAGAGGRVFDQVTFFLANPAPPDATKLSLFGVGAVLYAALAICQYRFYWWPLHPIGLATASLWNVRLVAVSVFVAWLLKAVSLGVGGISLYRQLRPFFIGLIVGFFLGVGLSYGIDAIWFFGKGHPILHG